MRPLRLQDLKFENPEAQAELKKVQEALDARFALAEQYMPVVMHGAVSDIENMFSNWAMARAGLPSELTGEALVLQFGLLIAAGRTLAEVIKASLPPDINPKRLDEELDRAAERAMDSGVFRFVQVSKDEGKKLILVK